MAGPLCNLATGATAIFQAGAQVGDDKEACWSDSDGDTVIEIVFVASDGTASSLRAYDSRDVTLTCDNGNLNANYGGQDFPNLVAISCL